MVGTSCLFLFFCLLAGITCRPYSEIEPEEVEWLWERRIPLGKLTCVQGDPGDGKTYVALDIASHVSTGKPFSDGSPCPQGKTLFVTAEDGPGDTIRKRLDALGAKCKNIIHLVAVQEEEEESHLRLDDHVEQLEQYLSDHPDIKLIVLDPITSFLGSTKANDNVDVRNTLNPLIDIAERQQVAIVAINHLNKDEKKAIYKSLGSVAFAAVARAVWAVCRHPDDEEKRFLLPVKMNLCKTSGLIFESG